MQKITTVPAMALLLAACCGIGEAQPSGEPTLETFERAYFAARSYAMVHMYFAHWETATPFFEDSYRAYLFEAMKTERRRDFDLATMKFMAILKNGQTAFTDTWLDENYGQPLGFGLAYIEGKWVVTGSSRAGIGRGDVIEAIDGKPFEEFFRDRTWYISADSERASRALLPLRPHLFPHELTLTLAGGRNVSIDRRKPVADWRTRAPEGRWIVDGRIAYLSLPSFADVKYEQAAINLLDQYQRAGVVILDLRGNSGGGVTPTALIKALMDRSYRGWKEFTPANIGAVSMTGAFGGAQLAWMNKYPAARMADLGYRGLMVALIDGGCGDTCEDVVMPMKDTRRAQLVGETTMGSSGPRFRADLRNGMAATVGDRRYFFPDGSPFAGIGVKPDVEAPLHLADLAAAKDAALDKAIAIAEALAGEDLKRSR